MSKYRIPKEDWKAIFIAMFIGGATALVVSGFAAYYINTHR